jgi:hypothetical protein
MHTSALPSFGSKWKSVTPHHSTDSGEGNQYTLNVATLVSATQTAVEAVILGEIGGYHQKVNSYGYPERNASVHLLDRLKGATGWNVGEIREISIPSEPGWAEANLRHGGRFILFGGWGHNGQVSVESDPPCAALPINESTLSFVRRGIDQDYGASDKAE